MICDGDKITIGARSFRVNFPSDDDSDAPWDGEDGHGPVSDWTTRDKRPGEMVLCSDRQKKRFYDFSAAIKTARRESWDAPPYTGSKGERAHRAVMADYRNLRAWCENRWCYIGVVARELDRDGTPFGPSESLWGIESDAGDYLEEIARELIGDLIAREETRNVALAATLGVQWPVPPAVFVGA